MDEYASHDQKNDAGNLARDVHNFTKEISPDLPLSDQTQNSVLLYIRLLGKAVGARWFMLELAGCSAPTDE
jgi:hypothetical protein